MESIADFLGAFYGKNARLPSGNLPPVGAQGFSFGAANSIGTDLAGNKPTPGNFIDDNGIANIFVASPHEDDAPAQQASDGGPVISPDGGTNGGGSFLGLDLGDWLARIAIIVLGFIFVAAGLSLFKSGSA